MPLTNKGTKIMKNMVKQYGKDKAKKVFYASRNAKKITGVDPESSKSAAYIQGWNDKLAQLIDNKSSVKAPVPISPTVPGVPGSNAIPKPAPSIVPAKKAPNKGIMPVTTGR